MEVKRVYNANFAHCAYWTVLNLLLYHISFEFKYLPFFSFELLSLIFCLFCRHFVRISVSTLKWNELSQKKKTVSNSLWWLSPIDWRRRILLVYFIYLAREHFKFFAPLLLCASLCGTKSETISDFNMSFCVHTETIYIFIRGTSILLLLRYFVRNNNNQQRQQWRQWLSIDNSTFDSCVWCILSVFRQAMWTTTWRSRQLRVTHRNENKIIHEFHSK